MHGKRSLIRVTFAQGRKSPISTVEHETTQLEWDRKGVPICVSQQECEALNLTGAPLPIYLSNEEEELFKSTGSCPGIPRFCLLCIRRDAHALSMLRPQFLKHQAFRQSSLCASSVHQFG